MKSGSRRIIGTTMLMAVLVQAAFAQAEAPPAGGPTPTSASPPKAKNEFYGALSILGTIPIDENLDVGGTAVPNTNVKGSVGAGLKAGIIPKFTNGMVGVEGEVFGHGGNVTAPQAQGDLAVINFMVNVIARYPGEVIQPYIGTGIGVSAGQLSDANIRAGSSQLTGKSTDGAFAYQFLGGIRAYVTKGIFLFGEYKYFAANYKWESEGIGTGSPATKLDFRTQIVSGGIGISF
ncbi:outer membrane protein [Nitrospira moscoviensis]|uniref:Outer membrane protein beta-barrel domain-containing protein n=1 Tax=Nitrospira moscoviensis TaxID=42253 RepID=A0A0K2GJ06_NITMO|nr:outer membrane beta-barrel protein [Nitrospira moscoviensis]ALA60928.1 conserved exported protein of unknown function [Nitrospira moscoviensis]